MEGQITLLVLLAIIASTNTSPSNRIVGGSPVVIEEFPFLAAILAYDASTAVYAQICGATILTSYYVMTAAQCVVPYALEVRVGSSQRSSGGELLGVVTRVIHPDYDSGDCDLAVLGLAGPIMFDNAAVAQGPLPFQDMAPVVGMMAFVAGWGRTDLSGDPSEELRFGQLSITDHQVCSDAHSSVSGHPISDSMVCAWDSSGSVDVCAGDFGGPLVSSGVVVGVASYSHHCSGSLAPSVYTNVARFTTWLQGVATGVPIETAFS